MIESTDQLGRTIALAKMPERIISLVPSQTELLYDLGLREEVVGITKFCIHPEEWFRSKTRVGGTKKVDFEKIKSLQPDLIIANKEENEESQVKELMRLYPTWISDIKTLEDALTMILSIGKLTGKEMQATELSQTISGKFKELIPSPGLSVAYIIWQNPLMTAGGDTFINDMLQRCGLRNVFNDKLRYPQLSNEELIAANPNLVLLSSEPYPFKEKHIKEFKALCPKAMVLTVDGELFSWYGSRLIKAPEYFNSLLHQIKNAF